jgi:hypothetical protein
VLNRFGFRFNSTLRRTGERVQDNLHYFLATGKRHRRRFSSASGPWPEAAVPAGPGPMSHIQAEAGQLFFYALEGRALFGHGPNRQPRRNQAGVCFGDGHCLIHVIHLQDEITPIASLDSANGPSPPPALFAGDGPALLAQRLAG